MLRPDYRAHAVFIAPARRNPALWRFLVGLVFAAVGYVALNEMFFQNVYAVFGPESGALYDDLLLGRTPTAMYLLLFSFIFMTMAVGLSARLFHGRSALTLLGPLVLMGRQFARVSVAMVLLGVGVTLLPPWDMGAPFVENLTLGHWLSLLPFSLLAVLVQTSAEEVVFRGYVQQQLAARFRSPLIWMILPSVLFGMLHYIPDEAGENALFIAAWATVFGMMMVDLTARSGSLGPALAVHFWNNVSAILLVSVPDNLSGLALYLSPFGLGDAEAMRAWLPVDFGMMFVTWLAARLAIRR